MLYPKQKYFGWSYQTLRLADPTVSVYEGLSNGKEIRRRRKSIQRGYVKVFNPAGEIVTTFLTAKRAKAYIKERANAQV